jgi:hypothetical protein
MSAATAPLRRCCAAALLRALTPRSAATTAAAAAAPLPLPHRRGLAHRAPAPLCAHPQRRRRHAAAGAWPTSYLPLTHAHALTRCHVCVRSRRARARGAGRRRHLQPAARV